MDLLQLEHFLGVVDEHSLTRAAERIGRTQSAVSQSVKKLEDEVGTALFVRDVHEISLTDAGKALEGHARRMVRGRDEAMREIGAIRNLTSGTLTIAAHESAAVYLLPGALKAYLGRFPRIKVGIYRSRLTDIPRQVMDREVHVGFVKDEPCFRELTSVEVHADEMVLVASRHHPLASRRIVNICDLGDEPLVVHHLCGTTEQLIQRLFEEHRTPCKIAAELWSFENIKTFVLADVGVAIVPGITVAQELRDGTLVRIPVPQLNVRRRTLMIYREHGYLSDSARELIKIVRTYNWDATVTPMPLPKGA